MMLGLAEVCSATERDELRIQSRQILNRLGVVAFPVAGLLTKS